MSRRWQPTPALRASVAVHGAAALGGFATYFEPRLAPWVVGTFAANQALLVVAGLLPRSTLLGPNLTRLPPAAQARGEVTLTIDDGPDPEVTPRALDLLDAAGARASFFCIGTRAQQHAPLLREIVARGHEVENHSMRHLNHFALLGPAAMQREVLDAQRCLADLCGREPRFFRPTAGLRSPLLEPILARADLQLASWTRRAYDTVSGDPERAYARLGAPLAGGDIVLLHDGNAARTPTGEPLLLAVLPRLLQTMAERGLRAVTLAAATASTPR